MACVAAAAAIAFLFNGAPSAAFQSLHYAARLVLSGNSDLIYQESPARWLLAPGLTWIFAPIGLLPLPFAFAGFQIFKIIVFSEVLRSWVKEFDSVTSALSGVAFLAFFVADQVSGGWAFLASAAAWFLLKNLDEDMSSRFMRAVAWALGTILIVASGALVPLLFVPYLRKRSLESTAVGLSLGTIAAFPILSLGINGYGYILRGWMTNLVGELAFGIYRGFGFLPSFIEAVQWTEGKLTLLSMDRLVLAALVWMMFGWGFVFAWYLRKQLPTGAKGWMSMMGIALLPFPVVSAGALSLWFYSVVGRMSVEPVHRRIVGIALASAVGVLASFEGYQTVGFVLFLVLTAYCYRWGNLASDRASSSLLEPFG